MTDTYQRASHFDTGSPDKLKTQLERMDRMVDRSLRGLPAPRQWRSARQVSVDTAARLGEMLVVDSSGDNVNVFLPQIANISAADALSTIAIIRTSASNTVKLVCTGADLINGQTSVTATAAVGVVAEVFFTGQAYYA